MKIRKIAAIILSVLMVACSLGITAFAKESKPYYLVLGDSIGYGSGLLNPKEAVYGKIVADTNGYEYQNDAVPGHTTTDLIERIETDEVSEHIKKADIISITIGGNNFLLANVPLMLFEGIVLENFEKIDELAKDFYKDIGTIEKKIHSLNSDAVILFQTIYNPQTGYIGEVYQFAADKINAQIIKYAKEHTENFYVVDIANALTDHNTDFAVDGIHPSAAGNEKIAVEILRKLKDLGLGKTVTPVINTPGKDITNKGNFTAVVTAIGTVLHFLATIRSFFKTVESVLQFI
jgi:lysophospholipase L1-like esterase